MQLLLASHNLSGMSYFGGLGRNILCNVSLSQGNKFLRPPAVSMVPCFHARRTGHVSASILRLESSSELLKRIFTFEQSAHFAFLLLYRSLQEEKRGSFSPPSQGRRPKRISLSFSFSFSVFRSFLGRFLKPRFVTFDDFQKWRNPNFLGRKQQWVLHSSIHNAQALSHLVTICGRCPRLLYELVRLDA